MNDVITFARSKRHCPPGSTMRRISRGLPPVLLLMMLSGIGSCSRPSIFDQNVELAKDFWEALYAERDVEAAAEFLAGNVIALGAEGTKPDTGITKVKKSLRVFLDAFPDARFALQDANPVGNRILLRWSGTGTYAGSARWPLLRGRRVEVEGVRVVQIAQEKITQTWDNWDISGSKRR